MTREELEEDAYSLLDLMESRTISESNHFTTGDIQKALEAFDEKWITYPRNSVEYKSGIRIKVNKRNGRKQTTHLRIARQTLEILNEDEGQTLQGRKPKREAVEAWQLSNPGRTKAECIRETGLSKPTVYKYWKIIEK